MPVLHLKDAVLEHHAWWERFERVLHSHPADTAPSHVIHDHECTIGQWLHGEGARAFAEHHEFQKVKTLHGRLHDLAAKAWQAKVDEAHDLLDETLEEIKRIRHDMFMAWGQLNDIIGVYD